MKKQPGIVILISNKTDLKQKLVRRRKQKHFLLSKEKKIQQQNTNTYSNKLESLKEINGFLDIHALSNLIKIK